MARRKWLIKKTNLGIGTDHDLRDGHAVLISTPAEERGSEERGVGGAWCYVQTSLWGQRQRHASVNGCGTHNTEHEKTECQLQIYNYIHFYSTVCSLIAFLRLKTHNSLTE